jgi:hypothetical protein
MEITIARRFCGPPASGNGGYSAGLIAAAIPGPAEVTLRAPPPLETPLRLERSPQGAELRHGEQLVGEGRFADFSLEVPAVSWREAEQAGPRYAGFAHHDWPTCFVCGTSRKPGDGMCVFCGPVRPGLVAATWAADPSLGDAEGRVRPEFLWAAIDCPGAWAVLPAATPLLLGRLAGRFFRGLRVGEPCIVLGWHIASEGRKHHVGSALVSRDGETLGYGRATWLALKAR